MRFPLSIYLVLAHALLAPVAGLMEMSEKAENVGMYTASNTANDKQNDFSEYVLKRVANYNNSQDTQDAPVDRLVMHLNKDLARLVDGAAGELGKTSSEVYEGVSALIRARGGGGRGPRHHFNPGDFLDSLYNDESRKFVERMYELFKQLVGAYVKSVSESGLDENPRSSTTASSRLYPTPTVSTAEPSSEKKNDDTKINASTSTSTSTSKSIKATKSKPHTDRDEDDEGEDDGSDDDDDADTDDESADKKDGKDRQRAESSNQITTSTTPDSPLTELALTSSTSTTASNAPTTVSEANATSL